MPIPIIDLFAGPGGLAEGFSSLVDDEGNRFFDIKLSIEKDVFAHQTLTLRSFLRQFPLKKLPDEYYSFLREEITIQELYDFYPDEHHRAKDEALLATLGETSPDKIDDKIRVSLNGNSEWVLIGGPPCQAYSLAGRSRVGGIHEGDHRVELYKEYLRIIACHQPAVFVMENVKGLLSAKLNDGDEKIFHKILKDLRDPSSVFKQYISQSYTIYSLVKSVVTKDSDYLIKAEEFGVPQKRHRVILLGLRNDVNIVPATLNFQKKVTLKSIIDELPPVRSGVYREFTHSVDFIREGKLKKKRFYISVKDSYQNWLKYINRYSGELSKAFKKVDSFSLPVKNYPESIGQPFLKHEMVTINKNHPLYNWYTDAKIKGIVQHVSRSHLVQDLKRYLFACLYTNKYFKFPRMEDYQKYGEDLLPDHTNVNSGKFNDRFRVQMPNEPATTVTSHISKDGHYFIHYDETQCRSFTVREAARVQTFPDNYYFCGSRTQQLHQVGNAVPPYLAYQISKIVLGVLEPNQDIVRKELVLF